MMKRKFFAIGAVLLAASSLYGVSLLSPTLSQVAGGVLTTTTLSNLVADFAAIGVVLGGATGAPSGTGAIVLGTSPTITSPTLVTPALGVASITSLTGLSIDCATTAACPSTARAFHTVQGIGLMATGSPSTYAVTAMSPAFTGSTTYNCYAQDVTTVAVNIGVLTAGYVSGSAVTFNGPNSNTDTFRFYCYGY